MLHQLKDGKIDKGLIDDAQLIKEQVMTCKPYASAERVFWICSERGNALVCERQCGGSTGYACPRDFFFSNGIAPNVLR